MLHFHKLRPVVSTLVVAAFLTSNAQAVSLANIEGLYLSTPVKVISLPR